MAITHSCTCMHAHTAMCKCVYKHTHREIERDRERKDSLIILQFCFRLVSTEISSVTNLKIPVCFKMRSLKAFLKLLMVAG